MEHKHPPLVISPSLNESVNALLRGAVPLKDARHALGHLLQSAIRLEFATIPPYLSAAYSLDSRNAVIQQLILRIAREEMLHMTAVANIMNAIGVAPDIVGAVPSYPCQLDLLEPPLNIDLESFSFPLVEDLLMRIEVPEDPVVYPKRAALLLTEAAVRPRTIGQFYGAIIDMIEAGIIPGLFENAERDKYKQIVVDPRFQPFAYLSNTDVRSYPLESDITFLIVDETTAVRHLRWIVDQGEGSEPYDPLDGEGIPGHYYRLASIKNQQYLIPDQTVPNLGYSYSGADLIFNVEGVHVFDINPKVEHYEHDENLRKVWRQMKRLNTDYTSMVDALNVAFNCPAPDQREKAYEAYLEAIALMGNMPNTASAIVAAAREKGVKAGLPFQYTAA